MTSKAAVNRIIETLKGIYPDGLCSLQYKKDYELLFAVRLVRPVHRRAGEQGDPGAVRPLPYPGKFCRGGSGGGGRIHPLLRLLQRKARGHRGLCPEAGE